MRIRDEDFRPGKQPRFNRIVLGIAVVAVLVLIGICLVPFSANETDKHYFSDNCQNNLRQISLALRAYHDQYGCFPPASIADKEGRPMHSWRTLILPYLDERPLYQQYRFDEPWNGPHNGKLVDVDLEIFRCMTDPAPEKGLTNYVAVVGPNTAWPAGRALKLDEISGEKNETIQVVEVVGTGIHWAEPRDFDFNQMVFELNRPVGPSISSNHGKSREPGAHVVFCDGSVMYLANGIAPETLRRLLECNNGPSAGDL